MCFSPSDVCMWADCQWSFLCALDNALGRTEENILPPTDAMGQYAAHQGNAHESTVKNRIWEKYGDQNCRDYTDIYDTQQVLTDIAAGMQVLYQPYVRCDHLIGIPDFLIRDEQGTYHIYDAKLALSPQPQALLQLSAYVYLLQQLGIKISPQATVILGDNTEYTHDVTKILHVFRSFYEKMLSAAHTRCVQDTPLDWFDPTIKKNYTSPYCEHYITAHRDVNLVARMSPSHREKLIKHGITTIDALADLTPEQLNQLPAALHKHHYQAVQQIRTEHQRAHNIIPPAYVVVDNHRLHTIPAPHPGDIFFDFEGDPLYTETTDHNTTYNGLDYLFGWVDNAHTFTSLWAHTIAEERQAFTEFIHYLTERLTQYPDMHVYHYAPYEQTHLRSLAMRHQIGEKLIDELLRNNILIDLYPIVCNSLIIGENSYSIKKLEPLYLKTTRDDQEVTTAVDSITAYSQAMTLVSQPNTHQQGVEQLEQIRQYNAYDCISTITLRDWLLQLQQHHPHTDTDQPPATERSTDENTYQEEQLPNQNQWSSPTHQQQLHQLLAIKEYLRREEKIFWWAHYHRLNAPIEEWEQDPDLFFITSSKQTTPWHKSPRAKVNHHSERMVKGYFTEGSTILSRSEGAHNTFYGMYFNPPHPIEIQSPTSGRGGITLTAERITEHTWETTPEINPDTSAHTLSDPDTEHPHSTEKPPEEPDTVESEYLLTKHSLRITENVEDNYYYRSPDVLTPGGPVRTKNIQQKIDTWIHHIISAGPQEHYDDLGMNILTHTPTNSQLAPVENNDYITAITTSLLNTPHQYLAVQGPPGTGKTYTGSRVVAHLARTHQWKILIIAQSHAVINNFLTKVHDVLAAQHTLAQPVHVIKRQSNGTFIENTDIPIEKSISSHYNSLHGLVVGSTPWIAGSKDDPTGPESTGKTPFDLVVIEEAGQCSLPMALACASLAPRMLLLGDPQQLPNVSQASHPENANQAILQYIANDHPVLPPQYGYFLNTTHRMHPALTRVISQLAYQGKLTSMNAPRSLENITPGLHTLPVAHHSTTNSSPQEASAIITLIKTLLGTPWTDQGHTRPLGAEDIIIVAPYNAHVQLIREHLQHAHLHNIRVGTVDLFQGQEGVIAILSMASSDVDRSSRGYDFLLDMHRLNVAISRAQWAAYLVYSPELTNIRLGSIAKLETFNTFLTLLDGAVEQHTIDHGKLTTKPLHSTKNN